MINITYDHFVIKKFKISHHVVLFQFPSSISNSLTKKVKQAGAELCQAQVKLEVIVEADLYLEMKMKLATTILCDWGD